MTEKFNFGKHLTSVVAAPLRDLGFKRKGTSFSRCCEPYVLTVRFSRSSWNLPGLPHEFYLEIIFYHESDVVGQGRLEKPTTRTFPQHFQPFLRTPQELSSEERNELERSFSQAETEEIKAWLNSRKWLYSDESALKEELKIAVAMLTNIHDVLIAALVAEATRVPAHINFLAAGSMACHKVYQSALPDELRWQDA